jgi:hypothetical protein
VLDQLRKDTSRAGRVQEGDSMTVSALSGPGVDESYAGGRETGELGLDIVRAECDVVQPRAAA